MLRTSLRIVGEASVERGEEFLSSNAQDFIEDYNSSNFAQYDYWIPEQ